MQNYLKELQKGFRQNTNNISKFIEGLSEKETLFRPFDKVNHIVWNLGHITFVRNTIIKLLDPNPSLQLFENERDLFAPSKELMPSESYPPIALILEYFIKRGEKINQLLADVTDEHLQKESWLKIGSEPRTNENLVFYFYNHETEHLGEIKLLKNLTTRLRKPSKKKKA